MTRPAQMISRFGSPEQETMVLLGEIPAARRQYRRATAAAVAARLLNRRLTARLER